MSQNKGFPGLACASEEREYQVLGDERYLYFVCLGKAGAADPAKAIPSPESYEAGWGNVRMPKTGVESVQCTRRRGLTTIVITKGEKAYRFKSEEEIDEAQALAVFGGLPLHLTLRGKTDRAQSVAVFGDAPLRVTTGGKTVETGHADRVEIILFILCFAIALLRIALSAISWFPGGGMLLTLGWMLIPLLWLVRSARKEKGDGSGLALGVGAMASIFSCVFLWLSPSGRPDSWMPVILPSVIIALLAMGVYAAARRRLRPLPILAVGAAALLCFAPGAARCLNEMLPARSVTSASASVVELSSQYDRGDWQYYVVVEADEVQSVHQISREEYSRLTEASVVEIVRTTGALGVSYTDVVCEGTEA